MFRWVTLIGLVSVSCFAGCGSSDSGSGSGGSSAGGNGGTGNAACQPTDPSCYVAGPTGPGAECLAKADFSGKPVTQLRMSSHQVASPAALAAPFMQDGIITAKSTLDDSVCNQFGKGEFNYLMEIDTAASKLTIGGGVPQKLPGLTLGTTCWTDFTDQASGLQVGQKTASYTLGADGKLTALFDDFVMPIFLEDKVSADSYVLVPLHQMTFTAKLSDDHDCVGRFAPERLDKGLSCQPAEGQFAWDAGGRYEGYITVEEADKVMVVSVGMTLCVVLTGDTSKWRGTNNDCATSKGFQTSGALPKGDWCSTTNTAGGCQDAWKLSIDFAAQAVTIKGNYDSATGGC